MDAKVQSGKVLEIGQCPVWRYPKDHATNPGEVITDAAVYRAGGITPSPDAIGWYPISDERMPDYDPATERPPLPKSHSKWIIKEDRVVRTWNAPTARSFEDVLTERIRSVEQKHRDILNGGFDYDFGTKTVTLEDGSTEPAGVRRLQTKTHDRERWQATNQVATQFIGAGMPDEPMRPFRTADNARVPVTAQEVNDCLNAMQARFGQALDALWDHKDALRQLTTVADVVAYDTSTLWP